MQKEFSYKLIPDTFTTGFITYNTNRDENDVDVFNFTDPFYTSRCFVYQQNGVDIPLNSRRHLLFPNTTVSCGTGCTYSGIDNETNMVCECKEQNKCSSGDFLQDFKKELLETIESSNILILECNVSTIII